MEDFASGLAFPEGPIVLADGSVLVVEIKAQTLTRCFADGTRKIVAHTGGGPNGAAIGPDGACYVCNNGGFEWHIVNGLTRPVGPSADYAGGRIERVDLESGETTVLYTASDKAPLKGPNDIVFDKFGGFYFTDLGKSRARDMDRGALCYAKPDGSMIREIVQPMLTPNGIGLSPEGDRLYTAETHTGRLWAFELEGPGMVKKTNAFPYPGGTLVAGLPGLQLFDSLAVEANGNICVATLLTGGITVFSPEGEIVEFVKVPDELFVTNICFGGDDMRTAYITASGTGRILKTRWARPGLKLHMQ